MLCRGPLQPAQPGLAPLSCHEAVEATNPLVALLPQELFETPYFCQASSFVSSAQTCSSLCAKFLQIADSAHCSFSG